MASYLLLQPACACRSFFPAWSRAGQSTRTRRVGTRTRTCTRGVWYSYSYSYSTGLVLMHVLDGSILEIVDSVVIQKILKFLCLLRIKRVSHVFLSTNVNMHMCIYLGGNSRLQDFKTSKDFTTETSNFHKTSKDFQKLPKTSKDFKRLQKTSRDFKRLQETSRDFKRLQETS
jgi:hypothetical protein